MYVAVVDIIVLVLQQDGSRTAGLQTPVGRVTQSHNCLKKNDARAVIARPGYPPKLRRPAMLRDVRA